MRGTKLVPLLALGLLLVAGCRDQVPPLAPDDAALAVAENAGKGPQVQPPRVAAYDFRQIDVVLPGEETKNTEVRGINARGDIVGKYTVWIVEQGRFRNRGFMLSNGELHTIHVPGALSTLACGINDRGDIVGYYYDPTTVLIRGFLLRNGIYTSIDYPGAKQTWVYGINSNGVMAGYWGDGIRPRGFLSRDGGFTAFEVPGATGGTYVRGINEVGDVVGYYYDSNKDPDWPKAYWPFVRSADGSFLTELDYPGPRRYAGSTDINPRGDIVGYYAPVPWPPYYLGFILDKHGTYTTLDSPHAPNTIPEAISPSGAIAGTLWWYEGGVWTSSGFVAEPMGGGRN